jgi:AhpD family alkylhydroperoxidase
MKARLKMGKVSPAAYRAIDSLDQYVGQSSVPSIMQELIRIRASQINGCAYCVHAHTQDALKAGEKEQRVNLVAVWKEAGNVFTEEEQAVLAMTEEITLIHRHGLSAEVYEKSISLFGEQQTAEIIMVIITINVWNRIGVGLKMEPEL